MFMLPVLALLATVASGFKPPSGPTAISRPPVESRQKPQQYLATEASFERRLVALFATAGEEEDVEVLRSRAAALRAEVDAMQEEQRVESEATNARRDAEEAADPEKVARKLRLEVRAKELAERPVEPPAEREKQRQQAVERDQGDDGDVALGQRALACLPYILPLSDVLPFGNYFLNEFPLASLAFTPAIPLIALLNVVPFGSFILFIGLTTLTRNPEIPRFTRFSVQQAILLDIALIFPQLLGSFAGVSGFKPPAFVIEPACTTVFFSVTLSILYCLISNAQGKAPNQIPLVSEAAERAIQ